MEPERQERRIGILVVVLVLLMVVLFWMLHPHTLPFRTERREAETPLNNEDKTPSTEDRKANLKKTLESIRPPAGDKPGKLLDFPLSVGNLPGMMVTYSTKADCATLEAHYKEEFAKHGFTDSGKRDVSEMKLRSLSFSSRDYIAVLGCTDNKVPIRQYLIVMSLNPRA